MANSLATLDPTSIVFAGANWHDTDSFGSMWGAIAATAPVYRVGFDMVATQYLDFGINNTFSMPVNSQLRALQVRLNAEYLTPASPPTVTAALYANNPTYPNMLAPYAYLGYNTLIYPSRPAGGPNTSVLDGASGPIWDVSSLGITDVQWNTTTSFQFNFAVLFQSNITYLMSQQGIHTLQIFYNQAPTATVNIGGSTGTFGITTLTPTVSWQYADPEGDVQERFRVTAYTGTTVNPANLIYDSGEQFSTLTSYAFPAGTFRNYTQYTIQVLVSDLGSNGRYSTPVGTAAVTITPQVDPILGPVFTPQLGTPPTFNSWSYNPSNGAISNLRATARANLLSFPDANFETSAGVASAGTWTVISGTSITLTPTQTAATAWHGTSWLQWTSATAGPQTISIGCGLYKGLVPGQIVTGIVHMKCSARRVANLQISFSNGSTIQAPGDINTGSWPISTAGYAAYVVQAMVPFGGSAATVTAKLQINIQGVVNADTGNIDGAMLTHGVINLLDNASFELASSGSGIVPFWTILNPNGGTGSVVTGDTPGNIDDVAGGQAVELNNSTGGTGNINLVPAYGVPAANGLTAFLAPQGCDHLLSTWAKGNALAGVNAGQFVLNFGASTSTYTPTLGSWLRFTTTSASSAFATSTDSNPLIGLKNLGTTAQVHFDDLSCERIWKPINLDFEIGTGGTTLPKTNFLGLATALTTNVGWAEESPASITGSCNFDTVFHNAGAQSLGMNQASTPVIPANVVASQLFTVSGAGTVTIAYAWKSSSASFNQTLSALLTFYNSAGDVLINPANGLISTVLHTSTTAATITSFATVSNPAVTVPVEAAFAKLSFSAPAPCYFNVDTITVTLGSAVGPCSVWQDGGWSQGGLYNVSTTVQLPVFLGVQASSDNVTYSRTVRAPGGFATLTTPAVPGVTLNFTDYEWSPSLLDTPITTLLYYRALMQVTAFDGSQQNSFPSPYTPLTMYQFGSILTLWKDWWLIDPAIPADNLRVGVQKFTASVTEDMGVLSGLGRARKVVVGDTVQGYLISLSLQTLSGQGYKNLMNQLTKQTTLLLRSPEGEQWYVRPTRRDFERKWTGSYFANTQRIYTVQLQEVDPLP